MDQYIIWILVYLNYINFVLNFILHTYDAQKLICTNLNSQKMWKKFNGRLWPSLAVKVKRLTDVIIVEFIIPLRVQHRCRKGIQLQFCLSFTSSCICGSFSRFLSFFSGGEGVNIHFFNLNRVKQY